MNLRSAVNAIKNFSGSFTEIFLLFSIIALIGIETVSAQSPKKTDELSENLKIDVYKDNEKLFSFFYDKNLLKELISYDTQTKTLECVTKYRYKKNGEFKKIKTAKGSAPICEAIEEFSEGFQQDFVVQVEFLKSKNIIFPIPDLVGDEIRDISTILSVMDNYDHVKKEIAVNGNQKTIKFFGLNMRIRFHPSPITLFIEEDSSIKDYELILQDNYPQSELITTDKGEFTRKYFYDDERRIIKILSKFNGGEDVKTSSEKRFEYQRR